MKNLNRLTIISAALLSIIAFSSAAIAGDSASKLRSALDAQPDEAKARYQYRHPEETLTFFGVEPGMTVVEILPGGGWYTKILLPYLGKEGGLIGVDYPPALWGNFSWMTPENLEKKKTWVSSWTAEANTWRSDDSATVSAFQFSEMPADFAGTADAVLFFRALHNLSRFEEKDGFLTTAISDSFKILKPGGIVGVVQHHAREDRPDTWADGSNGYIKQSFIVAKMQAGGFEFVGASDINANPKDQATEGDVVWRLPPSLRGSKENEEKRAEVLAIGESNRMTLKFRKPSGE